MKANIQAGNIAPTPVNHAHPPPALVQVQLRAATPTDDELVISPSVVTSSETENESTRTTSRKRSSEELEFEEEEEEEDNYEENDWKYVTRADTPPKRARTGDYDALSPKYVVLSPAPKLHKRRSEELDDLEERSTNRTTKKRPRTTREESLSPPGSTSPSEGECQLQLQYHDKKSALGTTVPKSVFPVIPTAVSLSQNRSEDASDDEGLYVLDETSSELDAEADVVEIDGR